MEYAYALKQKVRTTIGMRTIPYWSVALAPVSRYSPSVNWPTTAKVVRSSARNCLKAKCASIKRVGNNIITSPASTSTVAPRKATVRIVHLDSIGKDTHVPSCTILLPNIATCFFACEMAADLHTPSRKHIKNTPGSKQATIGYAEATEGVATVHIGFIKDLIWIAR